MRRYLLGIVRWRSTTVILIAPALAFAAAALATPRAQPSDRACLIAWNAPRNYANHVRLLAQRPISGLQLLPGVVGTDTWSKASTPAQTSSLACLLTLAKPGQVRVVTGTWRGSGVTRWSFGRPIQTTKPLFANVRLLSDGRVTKIYRH
jgi:hypothetical protein